MTLARDRVKVSSMTNGDALFDDERRCRLREIPLEIVAISVKNEVRD